MDRITTKQIFEGATFTDGQGSYMTLHERTNEIYGEDGDFDFSRKTKKETAETLNEWGYKYIGVE